jgi:hypothetical protein
MKACVCLAAGIRGVIVSLEAEQANQVFVLWLWGKSAGNTLASAVANAWANTTQTGERPQPKPHSRAQTRAIRDEKVE